MGLDVPGVRGDRTGKEGGCAGAGALRMGAGVVWGGCHAGVVILGYGKGVGLRWWRCACGVVEVWAWCGRSVGEVWCVVLEAWVWCGRGVGAGGMAEVRV